jgi:hypothetical protein
VVDVERRAAGDRQADAVRDQRVALGESVEDGDLVGQGGEPLRAIAAEILPDLSGMTDRNSTASGSASRRSVSAPLNSSPTPA